MNKRKYIPLSMVLGKMLDTDLSDIPKSAKNLLTLEMSTVMSWVKTNALSIGKFDELLHSCAKELDLDIEDYTSIYEVLVTNVYHNGAASVSPIKRDIAIVCYFLENNHILCEDEAKEFLETITGGMPCNEEQVAFDGDIVLKVEE